MLSELRIRNFTIISDLAVHFSGGLTVLSGETGAGKSIIVDAISMLLGDKASPEVIRTGAAEAQLSAVFAADTRDIADAFGISADDELLIRRTVPAHGKSRSFLNDVPFSIPSLVRVGASLVSIHGQHEQQDLLKREMHLAYLDRLAGLEANAADVRDKYDALVAARAEHDRMQQRMQERAQRIDYLRFQIAEIDASAVQPGEQNQLEEERRVLMNASRLQESSALAYDMLYDAEGSCIDTLGTVETKAAEISQVDPRASETLQLICSAHSQLKDAAAALRNLRDGYDADPGRLDVVENRLETLRTMEKKYGSGYEAISAFRTAAIDELAALEKIEERVQEGSEEICAQVDELTRRAEVLSQKRSAAAEKICARLKHELRQLGFQKAEFSVSFSRTADLTASGFDEAEFLFSANPGEALKPLAKVASGGELSRIMLALKSLGFDATVSEVRSAKTLIFDEVDAGIGGTTAHQVGIRLKKLAGRYQVFCITHLPQIAVLADTHLRVEKRFAADSVQVAVTALEGASREEELARMLSGRITEGSLKHARELLDTAKGGGDAGG